MASRVVLVTGSSTGIGEAVARRMAMDGDAVVVNSRSRERAERVAGELAAAGATVAAAAGDVGDPGDVRAIIGVALERFGRLDVLINNAGTDPTGPSETLSLEEWDQVLATNLTGAFLCAQEAGRHMLERGSGVIVNIGSIWGNVGMPERAAYATSKHALGGLTRALAAEWSPRGVRVVSADPSYIATAMIDDVSGYTPSDLDRRTPVGRLGTPAEVASAVAFLASHDAAGITGTALLVDGGWLAYGGW